MKSVILATVLLGTGMLHAGEVFWIGHSLINHNIPRMVSELTHAGGDKDHAYQVQIINGAPLKYHWENSAKAEGSDAKEVLPEGNVDVLVMTEAVPLQNHLDYSGSHDFAERFAALAREANPEIDIYLFETWHCVNSGTEEGCAYDKNDHIPWRDRLDQDLQKWQGIASAAGEDVKLVPGGQAMARLHDEIEAGNIPDLESIRDIFVDDIHMNDIGNYYMACLHYAVINGKSPEGLPHTLTNQWGKDYQAPAQELAATLQKLAWEVGSTK